MSFIYLYETVIFLIFTHYYITLLYHIFTTHLQELDMDFVIGHKFYFFLCTFFSLW
jgi:hypothetical protein